LESQVQNRESEILKIVDDVIAYAKQRSEASDRFAALATRYGWKVERPNEAVKPILVRGVPITLLITYEPPNVALGIAGQSYALSIKGASAGIKDFDTDDDAFAFAESVARRTREGAQ